VQRVQPTISVCAEVLLGNATIAATNEGSATNRNLDFTAGLAGGMFLNAFASSSLMQECFIRGEMANRCWLVRRAEIPHRSSSMLGGMAEWFSVHELAFKRPFRVHHRRSAHAAVERTKIINRDRTDGSAITIGVTEVGHYALRSPKRRVTFDTPISR
jgi:hypothetical protein